jgi:hypothetical protein
LVVNLTGYKGKVKKTAMIECNDPGQRMVQLSLSGTVRSFIEVRPLNSIAFRGRAEKLQPKTVELVGNDVPFHIKHVQSNLDGRVAHEVETVEEGRRYRLKVSNLVKQGDYNGALWVHTDLERKPYVMIRVTGAMEGEISISPKTLLIGRTSSQQPIKSGSVLVIGNSGKPFKITRLTHDEKLMSLSQHPLTDKNGYRIEITPKLENLPKGARQQTVLTVETDLTPDASQEVTIQVLSVQ